MDIIGYILLGCTAGFLGGLVGIGGGIIIVPLLSFIFTSLAMTTVEMPKIVIGTSHSIIMFLSMTAVYIRYKKNSINLKDLSSCLPAIVFGTLCGSYLILYMPALVLNAIFLTTVVIALVFLFFQFSSSKIHKITLINMFFPLTIISAISSAAGIGGGGLFTAYFIWRGKTMQESIALSIGMIVPISLFTTLYTISTKMTVADTFGLIYLPAFFAITPFAVLFSYIGVLYSGKLDPKVLRYVLSLCLVGLIVYNIYKV